MAISPATVANFTIPFILLSIRPLCFYLSERGNLCVFTHPAPGCKITSRVGWGHHHLLVFLRGVFSFHMRHLAFPFHVHYSYLEANFSRNDTRNLT